MRWSTYLTAGITAKVGALSYGGGFVVIPLLQSDVVGHYHWMTGDQFINVVALGQITPGPAVTQTIAVVGFAAAGIGGGILAATIAFAPSLLPMPVLVFGLLGPVI